MKINPAATWLRRAARRWTRRLLIVLMVAGVAYVFRAPLLRAAAGILVVETAVPERPSRIVILGGDHRYDWAAQAIRDGRAEGLLLVQVRPTRTQQLGIVPTAETVHLRELKNRGVAENVIQILPAQARSVCEYVQYLRAWMEQNPDSTLIVITDRFYSRQDRITSRRVLTDEQLARTSWVALPNREFDESNWWQVRSGGLNFGYGILTLTHTWLSAEQPEPGEPRTPDELEIVAR
jgi:uncharacterized SAM-binding protein YcdF (DUF218 family)